MFPMDRQDQHLIAAIDRLRAGRNGRGPLAAFRRLRGKIGHAFWSLVSGSNIAPGAVIARSVRFPHLNGVVIHATSRVGEDCIIMQQVTLGQLASGDGPQVGRGVYIGAGAKVLGPITIGDGARIGANAVVLADVPPRATVIGIPARIVRQRG